MTHPAPLDADLSGAALDRAYDARGSVPDSAAVLDRWRAESERARRSFPFVPNIAYGQAKDETLDFFPGEPGGPVLMFIHGGYWRSLTKEDNSFVAHSLVPAGINTLVIDYTLAPLAPLELIVHQCRTALAWTWRNASRYGWDGKRIHLAGTSAGGHLTGMMLCAGWEEGFNCPTPLPAGGMAISGLFDLRPVRRSYANEWARLDDRSEITMSPLLNLAPSPARLITAWGETETTPQWRRQSTAFADAWKAAGNAGATMPIPAVDHFTIALELTRPESALAKALVALCRGA